MRSSSLTLSPATVAPYGSFTVSVIVKNSGSRAGQEVVQVYATDLVSSVVTPNQTYPMAHLPHGSPRVLPSEQGWQTGEANVPTCTPCRILLPTPAACFLGSSRGVASLRRPIIRVHRGVLPRTLAPVCLLRAPSLPPRPFKSTNRSSISLLSLDDVWRRPKALPSNSIPAACVLGSSRGAA